LAAGREPSAGLSSFNRISAYLYLNQVGYFVDHASDGRCLFKFHGLVHPPQSKSMDAGQLLCSSTKLALDKRNFYLAITHR
jgi:hypothetical protein